MVKVSVPSKLSDLTQEEKNEDGTPKRNEYLQAISTPEVKSAMLVLMFNEVRIYKAKHQQGVPYDTDVGMAKLSAWLDIIDLQAFIEEKEKGSDDSPYQDEIPD
jgi:hypothetical protein